MSRFLARRDLSCGSGKVIQISSTSPSAKKEAIISMRVRRKPTLRICRSVAILAPRHMRAPLMSIPMKLRLGSRSASATVYSPLPQPSSSTIGRSLWKKSLCQCPLSGWSRRKASSKAGCTKHSNVRFSAKRLSLSLPICFYSLFCWLMPMASTPRTGIAGVKAIL